MDFEVLCFMLCVCQWIMSRYIQVIDFIDNFLILLYFQIILNDSLEEIFIYYCGIENYYDIVYILSFFLFVINVVGKVFLFDLQVVVYVFIIFLYIYLRDYFNNL